MKPRRTHTSDGVLRLIGGNEDSDLWYELVQDDNGNPAIETIWEPNDIERKAIANGSSVRLIVWGTSHPPVAVGVSGAPLGRAPRV